LEEAAMIPKKLLFCADFSENSRPAFMYAAELAEAFGAELTILHIVNSSRLGYPAFEVGVPFDLQGVLNSINESVDKAFQGLVEECKEASCKDTKTASRMGVPANEIVRFAEEESIELIIMGTHGWTGFRHLILGSTAENVVRTASCPVLTVKSGGPRSKGK
jgi:nucleotide-binding universal stress UspA family protein